MCWLSHKQGSVRRCRWPPLRGGHPVHHLQVEIEHERGLRWNWLSSHLIAPLALPREQIERGTPPAVRQGPFTVADVVIPGKARESCAPTAREDHQDQDRPISRRSPKPARTDCIVGQRV